MGQELSSTLQKIYTPEVNKILIKWILIWICVVGGLNYILIPLGFDYYNYYYVATFYFIFFAVLGLYHYKVKSSFAHHLPFAQQVFLMSLLSVFIIVIGFAMSRAYPISADKAAKIMASRIVFPLFYFSTWITKLADISFQQVYIFALLKELSNNTKLQKNQIIVAAGSAFAALHFPLIFMLGIKGLYFIIPSAFAGFIFTFLIMNYRKGLFYSYALHLVFYMILGLLLRYV